MQYILWLLNYTTNCTQIDASNLNCKITLVWLDSSLSVVSFLFHLVTILTFVVIQNTCLLSICDYILMFYNMSPDCVLCIASNRKMYVVPSRSASGGYGLCCYV